MQGEQQPLPALLQGVLTGQGAGQPGQFGAQLLRPGLLQQTAEGVQGAADAAGRAAQGAGGVRGGGPGGAGSPLRAERPQELGGLAAQIRREGVGGHPGAGGGGGGRVTVLCHAGASGRR